ncbi:MAG TPA: HAMP domain-containing sensor histidine kinase [Clostridia bacterium]|mgnify:CR=1 FL=1|nr:MAG: Alkaline phosphatase synthesis sensor protein PhoR [Firmicutes bacterium ADurb.Bin146]HOD92891.1 HAMP domain-containing sensor histidine kinase [Clostridia bacterium]HQM39141.1 HAMP domain-containing sensor histidine kinase [Clostridia bacterium]
MKNKMVVKLISYFFITLLVFCLVISVLFITLFRKYIVDFYKADMLKQAEAMSDSLTEYMGQTGGWNRQGGLKGYMRILDELSNGNIWIVDENMDFLVSGRGMSGQITYSDLPSNAEILVQNAFKGEASFSEEFSGFLDEPTLTVGVPIMEGDIIKGALLLHTSISGMTGSVRQGISIMFLSTVLALMISVIIGIILSLSFTRPLKKMKNTALALARKDYSAKTGVVQNDEIGQLAYTIDELSIQLDAASKESERLAKMKQDFMTNISHELKTPVTVIRGSAEALVDKVVNDPVQIEQYHKQILNDSIMLQRLVEDLLELSRLQNMDFSMSKQRILINDIISDAVHSSSHIAKPKNININLFMEDFNVEMEGDYARLRQMFVIVLDNAVKFSNQGSKIEVMCSKNTIVIKDYGCGISRKDIPYIFERFYKMNNEANRTGTGLGLAIAKQIANRHNIEILVNSNEGIGTEFTFVFNK